MTLHTLRVLLYGRSRVEGMRPCGIPMKRCLDVVGGNCRIIGMILLEAEHMARNRRLWDRDVCRLQKRVDWCGLL